MNLIARLPRVAAYIYRRVYKNGVHIEPDPKLDWAANFAHMLGYDDYNMKRLMRLYLTIHADHEGGNVSAHSTHLVGSALSDAYLSFAAGMNGLAGLCTDWPIRKWFAGSSTFGIITTARRLQRTDPRICHEDDRGWESDSGLRPCRTAQDRSALHRPDGIRKDLHARRLHVSDRAYRL